MKKSPLKDATQSENKQRYEHCFISQVDMKDVEAKMNSEQSFKILG
jgi:hypothetical protein